MRLTHIKLSGFKSFVDPTSIPAPGQLVAVIGPNGCGKSNVIDAIRWVLGEASAKQLRGQNMQDVIFNGSTTRKAVSRSMVELVFDNSDHQLLGAWGKYAEIAIKRTLTRQGESHYYINNQVVRRKDITDLFLGTGVGTRGYAIIEQGMISRIIEAKPEELRAYLEEAAGVSKYKERRRETEQRLQDTQSNLHRLGDLQSELERQIEKLEQQAKVAANYTHLTGELNHKQNLLTFIRLQEAQKAEQQAKLALEEQQTQLAQIETLLIQLGEESYQLQLTEHETQENLHQTQNQWALIREQRVRLEEKIRYQQSLHQRLSDEKLKTDKEVEELKQTEQKQLSSIEELKSQLAQQQFLASESQLQLESIQEELPEYEENLQQLEGAFLNQNNEQNRLQRERDLSRQKETQLQEQIQTMISRIQVLNTESQTLDMPSDEQINFAEEALFTAQHAQELFEQQIDEYETDLNQLNIEQSDNQQKFNILNTELITLTAQKNALEQLSHHEEQNHTQFWQEHYLEDSPTLWQNIQIDKKWQNALNIFLAERLYARSADLNTEECQPKEQTVWVNPNLIQTQKEALPQQSLRSHITAIAPFDTALDVWLAGIICVDNVAEALEKLNTLNHGQCFITPEGDLIDKASIYWQGSHETKNQLSWQDEINSINECINQIMPQIEENQTQANALKQTVEEQKTRLTDLKLQLKTHAQKLTLAHQQHTQLISKRAQTQLRHQHIEQERTTLKEKIEHTQQQIKQEALYSHERERALEILQEDYQATQNTRIQAQQALQNIRAQMYEASRRVGLEQIAEQKLQQELSHTEQSYTQTHHKIESLSKKQSELNLEFSESDQAHEPLSALEQIIETQNQLEETLTQIQDTVRDQHQKSKNLLDKQNELTKKQQLIQQTRQNTLLSEQQALLLTERLQEDLSKNKAKIDELHTDVYHAPSIEQLSEEVAALARKIERLGAVNLVALEELSQAKERQDYFNTQKEDLLQAIASLNDAIGQIDTESKLLFEHTFNAVNQKIQQYFPTLFGGGQANLEMIGDDPLSSGLAIMAHPPGKKNSSIHLLSGGEKALTAMSLVFALFSLNPAPFCLLDEVDAPLDDANTGRFCQLVQEMSKHTQFIFISHNRLTMQMADQLVGVTMQEKGVSRIVSVDIHEALKMQEETA